MAYVPNAQDPSEPIDTRKVSSMALEFRTLKDAIGFRELLQNPQPNTYAFVFTDRGKHVYHDHASAHTYTIPANSSVAFPIGTAITVINEHGAGVVTIAITTDELRRADTGVAGSVQIAADAVVTCVKKTATKWVISGSGMI